MRRADYYNTLGKIKEIVLMHNDGKYLSGDFGFMNSKLYLEGMKRDLGLIKKYIKSGKILDFGCGTGIFSVLCSSENLNVQAVDLLPDLPDIHKIIELEKEHEQRIIFTTKIRQQFTRHFGITFQLYDGKYLPYQDEYFDGVVAHALVKHITDEFLDSALSEIARVLKQPGLLFIFRTPSDKSYIEKIWHSHEKLINEKQFIRILKGKGFEVVRSSHTDFLPQFLPGRLQNILNSLTFLLHSLQIVLDTLPTKYISHNLQIVAKKPAKITSQLMKNEIPGII